jgi:ATP-dependent DNA helicase RecQ
VLRGEVPIVLREPRETPPRGRSARGKRGRGDKTPTNLVLDAAGQARFGALKLWRAAVAREHNLPAYVVFHDATLAQMAQRAPATLDALAGISGVGAKKLQAYGGDILQVLRGAGAQA